MYKLKLIKATVFILTFLLVFGSLVLLGTMFKKSRPKPISLSSNVSLHQPAGSSFKSFSQSGSRLFIHIQDGGLADRIVILNLEDGRIISQIDAN